jgi:hypothetical protein
VPADVTGTLTVGGSASTLSVAVPGTNLSPTFAGNAGEVVRVNMTNVILGSSSCCGFLVSLKKPDGTTLVSQRYVGTSGGSLDATLPTSGTYTVFATPDGATTGSITFSVIETNAPSSTSAPTITGTAAIGETLAATTGSWNGSPTAYGYQWQRCAAVCSDIIDADGPTYIVTDDDVPETLRVVVSATNASGTASAVSPQTAAASGAKAAPKWSRSYYVSTTNPTTWYDLGCDLGRSVEAGARPKDAVAFLHFGRPTYLSSVKRYGTVTFTPDPNQTTRTLRVNVIQWYGDGYWACSPLKTQLTIVATTSNQGSGVTRAHGVAWANMVDAANAYFNKNPSVSSQVKAYGGTDIELSWNTPAVTTRWVEGYASAGSWDYYVDGDAAGCPPEGGVCNGGWTNADVRSANWGNRFAWPVPQIYREDGVQAEQWQRFSAYSASTFGSPFTFRGAMTQFWACVDIGSTCGGPTPTKNSPGQGWLQLYTAINAHTSTKGNVRYSTDVRWTPSE